MNPISDYSLPRTTIYACHISRKYLHIYSFKKDKELLTTPYSTKGKTPDRTEHIGDCEGRVGASFICLPSTFLRAFLTAAREGSSLNP